MSEQPDTPGQAGGGEEGSHASVGKDVDRPGGGRTEGETTVDDAIGQEATPDQ